MDKTYWIRLRLSDGQTKDLYTKLPKPPEQYEIGEDIFVRIDEKVVLCKVEIVKNADNFVLYIVIAKNEIMTDMF
jgi:uncharacterized protein YuzE